MLGVNIPDTIVVQMGRPTHWFHTDEKTMRILLKDEELVKNKQYILAALNQRAGVSKQHAIVAGAYTRSLQSST